MRADPAAELSRLLQPPRDLADPAGRQDARRQFPAQRALRLRRQHRADLFEIQLFQGMCIHWRILSRAVDADHN
jgi:hypothetical protein